MTPIIVLFIVGIASGLAAANDDFRIIDSIRPEAPCSRAGGICTIANDCPEGQLVEERGLCPNQRSQGVECCFGISVKETRCKRRGGECMKKCNPIVRYDQATDCPESEYCCILV